VTAAAGGAGHFAVQLAKASGCVVVATVGSPAKAAALRALPLPPDRVVEYRAENLEAVLASEFPAGLDVALDGVGGPARRTLLRRLAPGGRLLQLGYISEYPHALAAGGSVAGGAAGGGEEEAPFGAAPAADLFWSGRTQELEGGRRIIGSVWPKDLLAIRRCRRRVFDLWGSGRLAALVDSSAAFVGLESIPAAVSHMLQGRHIGKVVVRLH